MKKVMIGILILIPILIVFIVAMVSAIVSTQAWISVEDLQLMYKGTEIEAETVSYSLDEINSNLVNMKDKIDVIIYPEKANKYVIEWQLVGDVVYTDEEYLKKYEQYKKDFSAMRAEVESGYPDFKDDSAKQTAYQNAVIKYGTSSDSSRIKDSMANELVDMVWPAVAFVDAFGDETASNSTGIIKISSYCHFTVKVTAENVSKTLLVSVGGDNVRTVTLSNIQGDESNILDVGQSKRIVASYTPIDSIVNFTKWEVLEGYEDIVSVDQNGVITAKRAGTAKVRMGASVHSTDKSDDVQYIWSAPYEITVVANGASEIFGSKVLTHNRTLKLEDIGIASYESVDGATIAEDGTITVFDGVERAVITTQNGTFTIEICSEDAFEIQNAEMYSYDRATESGYVLAIEEHTLKLAAVWSSAFKEGVPDGVKWRSSNETVARVNEDNGEVQGVSIGYATITASFGGQEHSIEIYVQNKIVSLQLRTSNASLAVGLARETVFASERYEAGTAKVANHTNIVVLGEPKRTENMSDGTYADLLREFYNAYDFEIVSGSEYASFDTIERNKLVFNPETLKKLDYEHRRQVVQIKVSAKYPRHEGASKYTQEIVDINVVHGVAVYNMSQLLQASRDQKAYTNADVIISSGVKTLEGINEIIDSKVPENLKKSEYRLNIVNEDYDGQDYQVWTSPSSERTYAIVLMANCSFSTDKNEDGTPVQTIGSGERPEFYGDVYGNNKMISAITGQITNELIRISWSNVTISNVILRANSNPENGEITSAGDTQAFRKGGNIVKIGSDIHWDYFRLENVNFEYSILENSNGGLDVRNTNISFNGCIIRNLVSCGLSIMNKMYTDPQGTVHPFYSHVKFNNFISSNTLASVLVATYEKYSYAGDEVGRFADDLKENEKYFLENIARPNDPDENNRHNFEITQTGMFEVYNWQNIEYATLFETGSELLDSYIVSETSSVIRNNPAFANLRYVDSDNTCYVHVAFVFAAVTLSGDEFIIEPTYQRLSLQDDQLYSLYSGDIPTHDITSLGEGILQQIGVTIYGYHNTARILPRTTYQVNTSLIDRLHG